MAISENIPGEINNLQADIKAEAIADQLLESGVPWKDIMVYHDQFFFRNFSHDLREATIGEGPGGKPNLNLHITRTGLYDILPEGLFFQPSAAGKKVVSASDMAEEYKANKKQELAVRNFFVPLEKDFFYHRLKNFIEEKELLSGLSNEDVNDYFIKFWGLAKDINPTMARKITLLLPYIHQIAGDAELMGLSLQSILGEDVVCLSGTEGNQQPAEAANILGTFNLGSNLVCGNSYYEDDHVFRFCIGPLKSSNASDYLLGGNLYKTVQSFYRFFVPVNADTVTEITLQPQKMHMILGNSEESILGIATVI